MTHILVIGGTGSVGRQVVSPLSAAGAEVRALARNPAARFLLRRSGCGDLSLPDTLDPCLDGIDAVFLVWTAPPPAVTPALERIAETPQRIVLLADLSSTS
jgi:uncharacterized protein YbjT (DUF2867 family)